jgi:hypothetical protein
MKWLGVAAIGMIAAGCASDHSLLSSDALPAPAVARLQEEAPEPPPHIEGFVAAAIRATVNGHPILDSELREACWIQLRQAAELPEPQASARQHEILKQELDKLIDREVVIAEAEDRLKHRKEIWGKLEELAAKEYEKQLQSMQQRANVKNEAEFRAVLAAQGMTLPNLKRQIERSFMSGEYMRSRIYPVIEALGHEDFLQYYNQHPGEFQNEDRVKWQDIFIFADSPRFANRGQAKDVAEHVAEHARDGEDWSQLATQWYNMGDSKDRKGDGLGQKRGEIKPPELEQGLFQMEPGQVAILELPTGFHVVRLAQREFAGPQPFDEKTQSEIKKKLQNLIADREYKRILKELRRKATIQVFLE